MMTTNKTEICPPKRKKATISQKPRATNSQAIGATIRRHRGTLFFGGEFCFGARDFLGTLE